jgi:hypothetical protein
MSSSPSTSSSYIRPNRPSQSLSELLEKRQKNVERVKGQGKQGKEHSVYDPDVTNNPIPKFKMFVPSALPAGASPAALVLRMKSPAMVKRGVREANSLRVDGALTKSPHLTLPESANMNSILLNPVLTHTIGSYDGLAWSILFNCKLSANFVSQVSTLAQKSFQGNGTTLGLITRLEAQLPASESPELTPEELVWTLRKLPMAASCRLGNDRNDIRLVNPHVRGDAVAGAPYYAPGTKFEEVLDTAFTDTTKLMYIASTEGKKGLAKYVKDHPAEFVTWICAKHDVMERDEYLTKVRPFGVIPASLRLPFASIFEQVQANLQSTFDNPESISAYHFSWSRGGASRLYQWTQNDDGEQGIARYRFLSWGDDQFITLWCEDGTKILVAPDVIGMDMKLTKTTWDLIYYYLLNCFGSTPLPTNLKDGHLPTKELKEWMKLQGETLSLTWAHIIKFYIWYAQNKQVMFSSGTVFHMFKGLLSGLTGTSIADFVASARLTYHLSNVLPPKSASPAHLSAWRDNINAVASKVGFPLKAATMDIQLLGKAGEPDPSMIVKVDGSIVPVDEYNNFPNTVIGLKFLGMSIVEHTISEIDTFDGNAQSLLVPMMDPIASATSSIFNKSSKSIKESPQEAMSKQQDARVGMAMMSFASEAYFFHKRTFDVAASQGAHTSREPLNSEVMELNEEDLSQLSDIIEFPSQTYYAYMFASDEERANIRRVPPSKSGDVSVGTPTIPEWPTSSDSDDDFSDTENSESDDDLDVDIQPNTSVDKSIAKAMPKVAPIAIPTVSTSPTISTSASSSSYDPPPLPIVPKSTSSSSSSSSSKPPPIPPRPLLRTPAEVLASKAEVPTKPKKGPMRRTATTSAIPDIVTTRQRMVIEATEEAVENEDIAGPVTVPAEVAKGHVYPTGKIPPNLEQRAIKKEAYTAKANQLYAEAIARRNANSRLNVKGKRARGRYVLDRLDELDKVDTYYAEHPDEQYDYPDKLQEEMDKHSDDQLEQLRIKYELEVSSVLYDDPNKEELRQKRLEEQWDWEEQYYGDSSNDYGAGFKEGDSFDAQ